MTEEDKPDDKPLTIADVVGIMPIEEMSKEELIDEMQRINQVHLLSLDIDSLRIGVMESRVKVYKQGILERLGITDVGIGYTKKSEE